MVGSDCRQSLLRPEVTHQPCGFCCADLIGLWADGGFWASLVEHSSSLLSFELQTSAESHRGDPDQRIFQESSFLSHHTTLHSPTVCRVFGGSSARAELSTVMVLQGHCCSSSLLPGGLETSVFLRNESFFFLMAKGIWEGDKRFTVCSAEGAQLIQL